MILFDKKLQLENKYTGNGYHKNNDKKAAQTAEYFGAKVERIYDVGVAGIHRLFARLDAMAEERVHPVPWVLGLSILFPSNH